MKRFFAAAFIFFILCGGVFAYGRAIYGEINFSSLVSTSSASIIRTEIGCHVLMLDDLAEIKPLVGFSYSKNETTKVPLYSLHGGFELIFHPWIYSISPSARLSLLDLYLRSTDFSKISVGIQAAFPFSLMTDSNSTFVTFRVENTISTEVWIGISFMPY